MSDDYVQEQLARDHLGMTARLEAELKPSRYRKMPVVIEAVRWDGSEDSTHDIMAWSNSDALYHVAYAGGENLRIKTLEGEMSANVGDWIIKGVAGELYPCKPDIFAATYEPVQHPATEETT